MSVIVSFALRASSYELVTATALFIGLGCIASSFPLSMTFTNQSRIGVWVFGGIGGAALFATVTSSWRSGCPVFPSRKGLPNFSWAPASPVS